MTDFVMDTEKFRNMEHVSFPYILKSGIHLEVLIAATFPIRLLDSWDL